MSAADIFVPGNLVKLKEEYEDGHGEMLVYITDAMCNSPRHFSGVAVVSKQDPKVGHHTNDYAKLSFEQFVGTLTLNGSL